MGAGYTRSLSRISAEVGGARKRVGGGIGMRVGGEGTSSSLLIPAVIP